MAPQANDLSADSLSFLLCKMEIKTAYDYIICGLNDIIHVKYLTYSICLRICSIPFIFFTFQFFYNEHVNLIQNLFIKTFESSLH
jgi:hypothetical protein